MTKRILIPTDFTVESLNVLKYVLEESKQQNYPVEVVFIHGYDLSREGFTRMFFYNKCRILDKISCDAFENALDILKSKYREQLVSVTKEIFSGWNKNSFENFLEGIQADIAYLPKGYKFRFKSTNSFDLLKPISRSSIIKKEVLWEPAVPGVEKGTLAEIFMGVPSISN